MGKLLLVRHGESVWNKEGKLTGRADIALTPHGKLQAQYLALKIAAIPIDIAYTSSLMRAKQTYYEIHEILKMLPEPVIVSTLDERDFGEWTGKVKKVLLTEVGEDMYSAAVKGWQEAPPAGESLEDVFDRVSVFYKSNLTADLRAGKNILIVAHHHVLRALTKSIENISVEKLTNLRLNNGYIIVYTFDNKGTFSKQVLI